MSKYSVLWRKVLKQKARHASIRLSAVPKYPVFRHKSPVTGKTRWAQDLIEAFSARTTQCASRYGWRGKWSTVSTNAGRRACRENRGVPRDSGNATGDRGTVAV